jgi:hypothetical protein
MSVPSVDGSCFERVVFSLAQESKGEAVEKQSDDDIMHQDRF